MYPPRGPSYTSKNSMRLTKRALPAAALLAASMFSAAEGQTAPAPTPLPAPATSEAAPPQSAPTPQAAPVTQSAPTQSAPPPAPASQTAPPSQPASAPQPPPPPIEAPTPALDPTTLRIVDVPIVTIARLPAENPFGNTADVPAALPPKLAFSDATATAGFFVSVHVDPTGKALSVRRERDPIPSLAAESLKSISRWVFTPGRRGGQPVDTWGVFRLDLSVEIRSPKVLQMAFHPVTPTTPVPAPFGWQSDSDWLETRRFTAPADGSVPMEQVDTAPVPQKTPWSADSYKGPFSVKFWVKVDKTGRITSAIPLEVSDPVLLAYFRKAMTAWTIRPAQAGGAAVESWNELTLGGQVSYSDDIKQIAALRRYIGS